MSNCTALGALGECVDKIAASSANAAAVAGVCLAMRYRQYCAWRVGWMERKRLCSCSKPALLLWGLFSLLLPAAAFWWAWDGAHGGCRQQQPQQYHFNGFKFYGALRLMLQLGGEAALFLLLPCSKSNDKGAGSNSKSSYSNSSSSGPQANHHIRCLVSYLFHLRYAMKCSSATDTAYAGCCFCCRCCCSQQLLLRGEKRPSCTCCCLRLCLSLLDVPFQLHLLSLRHQTVEDLVVYGPLLLQLAAAALQQQQQQRHACLLFMVYSAGYCCVVIACLILIKSRVLQGPSPVSLVLLLLRSGASFSAMWSVLHCLVLR